MDYQILSKINNPNDLKALPKESLSLLSDEIRDFLCEKVSKNGGHLASNLGVVEVTMAIHRVFNSPTDHIIFDVGHQCYVHKILTGRKDEFDNLRKPGYLSGFMKRAESEHDPFGAGHASTSVSAGLGFAQADKLAGNDAYTVIVLGDGAYSGGLVHEALNNVNENLKLIIILNENDMSISPTTGAFARQMTKLRSSKNYYSTKRHVANAVRKIPLIGKGLYRFISYVKKVFKRAVYGTNYFEELGLSYYGPIDGNDEEKVERMLKEAKFGEKAAIVHVLTKKGKGFEPAESEPSKYHGISPSGSHSVDNFSAEMGRHLCELAEKDKRICAVTAAMSDGTGLNSFKEKFPERFFDVGIAEEHGVTFSAALSAQNFLPVFAVYSTFLQRAYDNMLHDAALQNLPLTICVDRAALSGADGATHHGIYDVALANAVPGTVIYAPITFENLRKAMDESIYSEGIKIIRYPNSGELSADGLKHEGYILHNIPENCEKVVITYGKELKEVQKARKKMDFGIIVLEKLCPYEDVASQIKSLLPETVRAVLFAEEGTLHGGAGEAMQKYFKEYDYGILAITNLALGQKDVDYYKFCGISEEDILKNLQ